mmetsp:Transcript_17148/g.47865  ORF Transcript_17148/g.47865 Transcript_17148/m.47865 type:complete len:313 (-) Transcript_17148:317-1255(-)
MGETGRLPKLLISNDDGVAAPGLRALVSALHAAHFCDVYVSGPAEERSAQSHAITLRTPLEAWDIQVPGAAEAYAIDGTPADSVMLALNSSLFKGKPSFDLVVSGINRGDNAGLHVIYSGTVGAAREAACKGVRAVSLSLDNYSAKTEDHYEVAAKCAVPVIRAMLGLLPLPSPDLPLLNHYVVNVNFPRNQMDGVKGYHLTTQGDHCVMPSFEGVPEGTYSKTEEHDVGSGLMELRTVRQFRNVGVKPNREAAVGTDYWALQEGWVSVCPVGLHSDLRVDQEELEHRQRVLSAVQAVVEASAKELSLPCKL